MVQLLKAPWTEEQIAQLTVYQNSHAFHPYTCRQRDGHPVDPEGDHGVLVPTRQGWLGMSSLRLHAGLVSRGESRGSHTFPTSSEKPPNRVILGENFLEE